jgi:hypothetical protein
MAEIVCSYDDAVLPANDPWLQIVADVPSPSTPPGLCLATPLNPALSRSLKKTGSAEARGRANVRARWRFPVAARCPSRGSAHKTGLTTARGRSSVLALLAAAWARVGGLRAEAHAPSRPAHGNCGSAGWRTRFITVQRRAVPAQRPGDDG